MGPFLKYARLLLSMFCLLGLFNSAFCFAACCEKKEAPAPSFTYEIIESEDLGDCGKGAIIKIKTSGLPTNTAVALTSTGLDDCSALISDNLFVGCKGYLYACNDPERPFEIGFYNLTRGEPLTLSLFPRKDFIKKKNSRKCKARPLIAIPIVLFPIEAIDINGRRVSLVIASRDAKHFFFQGENFKPLEDVLITSKSGKETITSKMKVSEEGSFAGLLSPSIVGEDWGSATLSFKDKESEVMVLEYKWGIPE